MSRWEVSVQGVYFLEVYNSKKNQKNSITLELIVCNMHEEVVS